MARILVIDDSRVIRDLCRTYLGSIGEEIEFAESGTSGLWTFQRMGPDLVVSDIEMPGMNGVELARRIKEQSKGRVKVVLISAGAAQMGRSAVLAGDADAFVQKPIDGNELRKLASELLAPSSAARAPSAEPRIRVLVADDTEVGRRLIERTIRADTAFEVVSVAHDGNEAVAEAKRLRPQLVLLDALMPGFDGFEATRAIMREAPTRVVVVTRDVAQHSAGVAFEAARAGALDFLIPPPFGDTDAADAVAFRSRLKELAEIPVVRRWGEAGFTPSPHPLPLGPAPPADVVAICGSTGGPAVLARLLPRLREAVERVPVLVVQHMLPGFSDSFATWLAETTGISIHVAIEPDELRAGRVVLAPDGQHLTVVDRSHFTVSESAPIGAHRPSGTLLFESVAQVFGRRALAVLLTGMGEDGVEGLRAIKSRGGAILAQRPDTCVVPGMPKAAIAQGLVEISLGPEKLADEIARRVLRNVP